jgi:hypothetical protein
MGCQRVDYPTHGFAGFVAARYQRPRPKWGAGNRTLHEICGYRGGLGFGGVEHRPAQTADVFEKHWAGDPAVADAQRGATTAPTEASPAKRRMKDSARKQPTQV